MTAQRVVCDASVAVAWIQGEDVPGWTSELWAAFADERVELCIPSLFWIEVGNTLSRRTDLSDEQALEGLLRLQALGFTTLELDQALQLRALQLARAHGLTTYDALYLALADSLDALLATLEVELSTEAARIGRAYPSGRRRAVRERPAPYAADRTSLAALGARLAELRA
jgi:predicted nucleic acid-binding protein